jgi:hypothetical protein
MWQFLVKWALWTVGTFYIFIEKFRNYPNEERDNILGLKIDDDLQKLSRFELCAYMDKGMPKKGFWDLNSTTKIRLGAQMMRNLNAVPTGKTSRRKKKVLPRKASRKKPIKKKE